ncbi:MAG: DNA alkylation repair protein [Ghiorsea sp.]
MLSIPDAPKSIQKGIPLKLILDEQTVVQLANNLSFVHQDFHSAAFIADAMHGIAPLSITERSQHIASAMKKHLPQDYKQAIHIILQSLTPPLPTTEGNGLAVLFYMPHCSYIAQHGLNDFNLSMKAQHALTQRFSCEFSIRPFIITEQEKTMHQLYQWMRDPSPHVRRLCSEGSRPRLPWATKINAFVTDPSPALVILEKLKDDPNLYVRRSVANHVGDIAKDHIQLALELCESWLKGASKERKWVIRHALRNPVKKGNNQAIAIRDAAKLR